MELSNTATIPIDYREEEEVDTIAAVEGEDDAFHQQLRQDFLAYLVRCALLRRAYRQLAFVLTLYDSIATTYAGYDSIHACGAESRRALA